MAVIDEIIVVENEEEKVIDSANNKTIDLIQYEGADYHFARANEVSGKNLFDINNIEEGSILTLTGADYDIENRYRLKYTFMKAGTYTLAINGNVQGGGYLHKYSAPNAESWIDTVTFSTMKTVNGRNIRTATLDKDCYVRCVFLPIGNQILSKEYLLKNKPQLELNSTATEYETFSGYENNSRICEDAVNEPIIDMQVSGNSSQDGTPTPETPVEIESVGDKTKNLLDESKAETGSLVAADGSNFTSTNRARTPFVYVKKGTYIISMSADIKATTMFFYSQPQSSGYFIGKYATTATIKNGRRFATFPVEQDCYMRCVFVPEDETTITDLGAETLKNYNVMIEETPNLFDKNKVDITRHLTDKASQFNTSSVNTYNCSDFIEVEPNTRYRKTGSLNSRVQAYFDENKNFIEPASLVSIGAIFTTPSNCKYLVFNVYVPNAPYDDVRLERVDATDYEPYGYKISIKTQGKNLFGNYETIENTYIDSGGNYLSKEGINTYRYIAVDPNTTYTISGKSDSKGYIRVAEYSEDKTFIKRVYNNVMVNPIITITTTSTTKYLALCPDVNFTDGTVTNSHIYDIQIEKGSIATDYESYIQPTVTNIYLKEPLRKIGDYADILDYKNKKVVRKIVEKVFDGTETLSKLATVNAGLFNYTYYRLGNVGEVVNDINLCNMLVHQLDFSYTNNGQNKMRVLNSSTNNEARFVFRFTIDGTNVFEPTKVKELLTEYYNNGTPLKLYYAPTIPTEETIEVPEIYTLDGTTTLEADTSIEPSGLSVKYWKQI